MGGAASIADRNQQQNLTPQNKIFIDEGVGIEASQISRKWTTKLSLFKNIDGKNNMSEISNRPTFPQKPQKQVSLVYSSDESLSDPSYPMNPMVQDSDDDHQLMKKEIHPQDYKKITTFQSVSDDSDIEERYLHNERKHSKTQNQKNSFSDDDSQSSKEGPMQKLREQMVELLDQLSERDSVDTQQDLQFVDQLDLSDIMIDSQQQKQQLPPQFPLRRLYMRSRLGGDKMQAGQEKKVRFDAKQEQIYENDDFSQKIQEDDAFPEYKPEEFLNSLGIAITCKKGNKRDGPLKCDYMVYNDQYSKVVILTNGHGEFGQYIGNLTYRLIFHYLIHAPLFYTDPLLGLEKVMKRFQRRLNKYVQKKKQEDTYNMLLSGCSITVIIHRDTKLYLGHIGDNRVQIYKEHQSQGKQKKILIEPTPTHSPSDIQEKARIFNSGGEVRKNPSSEEFVFVRGRLYPQLHVTRSIGDTIAHAIGVSAEPFIREYDIIPYDTFLLLSTGPSLMYLDQDEVMNHLTGFTLKTIKSACESLYKQAKSSWIISEGTFDDMCIIMLWLGQLKELK